MATQDEDTILIFAANPGDTSKLSLDEEVREIQNGLRHSRKHFEIRQLWATRPKDLRRALLDHKPAYVHFCGHGAGEPGIVLEGHLVDAEGLAGLFGLFSGHIRCVVLNACYSVIQAHAIVRHIEYVVGMNKAIGDSAAIEFSTAFYDALGAGESVEFAFALGCNAIQLAGIPEHLTPVLLTRSADGLRAVPALPAAPPRPTHEDWDGAPAVSHLFGRDADAEVLRSWILGESCRVVLITGLGGVGKTDLATCLGRGGNRSEGTSRTLAAGIQADFETVIWRTLLNAPPPEDLFRDLVGFLSEHRRTARSAAHHQIEDVLRCMQERHCLVILDNVEAVLQPGDPGMGYRAGYEAYGAFFEQVAKSTHQSCLLLTSREKPRAIADLEGVRKPVRSFPLAGIGPAECRAVFDQVGAFSGTEAEWERIVRLYNGNPLALELVARHVEQVFDGNLGGFLGMGRPVFADLAELLDWHLSRLTAEETELVYWLAIEREPVSLVTLYDDLVSPETRRSASSTLQALQRRIPLERAGNGNFSLQPVLIEHVTARLVDEVAGSLLRALAGEPFAPGPSAAAAVPFNRYALVKATAKENVRESQRRLLLAPVAERLAEVHGGGLDRSFTALLDRWREARPGELGYAAGNVLNLLAHVAQGLRGLNVSGLPVWQACLHEVVVHDSDFSFCRFRHTTFKQPFGTVLSAAYSPDGQSIAVGDDSGDVRLFSATSGQFQVHCVGHSDGVWGLSFSPDGQLIASASFDHTVRLWQAGDGRCVNVLLGHRSWVYDAVFSPDGASLASVSEDGTCRLWNLRDGSWTAVGVRESFLTCAAFSPDGKTLAVGGSGGVVSLFRVAEPGTPMQCLHHGGRVRGLAFSPAGDLLASSGEDRAVRLWRHPSGVPYATLTGHVANVSELSFSAQGDLLASGSGDHTVRLWSVAREACVGHLQVAPSRVWAVHCSPTDRTLVTGSEDGAVRVWNMDTSECLMALRGYSNKTWWVAFSPFRSLLVAGNEDGLVRAWNVRDGRAELEMRGHASRVWAVATSPDGRWAASESDDLTVRLWDLQAGTCRHVLQGHTDWMRALSFHPDSRLLASAGEDGLVFVWDVVTGACVTRIESGMDRVFAVAFCDRGRCLAAGGSGDVIHLFAPGDGARLGTLEGHGGRLSAIVAPDPEAHVVASCSDDGTVKLWDLERRECTRTLEVGCKVWSGVFCDGGRSFVSAGEDGVLRRWALETGTCESQVRAHEGVVWSIAVNDGGDTLASTGTDGSIRLWELPGLTPSPAFGPLRPARPYEGMNVTGALGLTASQRDALLALGALSDPSVP